MITKEERPEKEIESELYLGPEGPNVFLSIEVSRSKIKKVWFICTFITLEREAAEEYIIRQWTRESRFIYEEKHRPLKLIKSWSIKKDDKSEKIIKEFVEKLQYLKGE